jgi:hypothetical protein
MRMQKLRILLGVAALLTSPSAWADDVPPVPDPAAVVDAAPSDGMTGKAIYQCVLDNRFASYVQASKLVSGDRGESAQESRLEMSWKNWRDEEDVAKGGILSKTIVRYTHPFDLRFSGYLIVNNEARANDQFVYLAASRRIRRVNLRKEAVFGTDFTFEDIVPHEIEDGDYVRLADTMVEDHPVYVVEVTPKEHADSEYSRFMVYVDKTSCVPLRTRYWDDKELEVKELTSPAAAIQQFEDVHWPMELTMRNLQLETFTTLTVEELAPNAPLKDREFEVRRLESH